MQKREPKPGRPAGSTAFDPELASALGAVIRAQRKRVGLSQEDLAHAAKIERSHMGKVERGEHIPSLAMIFKIADAIGVRPGLIVDEVRNLR